MVTPETIPLLNAKSGSLWTSLSKLQSTVRTIPHDSKGYEYTYASLDRVWDAIRQPLADAGLAVAQIVESVEGRTAVRTILAHCETGERIEGLAVAPPADGKARMSALQAMGADCTYLRRYGLSSILGLTTDADVDGAWMEMPTKGCTLDNPSPRVAYEEEQIDRSIEAGDKKQASLKEVRDWCVGLKGALREAKSKEAFTAHKNDAIRHFGELPEMVKTTLDTAYKVWSKGQTTLNQESK
jgi:hypothetical protein